MNQMNEFTDQQIRVAANRYMTHSPVPVTRDKAEEIVRSEIAKNPMQTHSTDPDRESKLETMRASAEAAEKMRIAKEKIDLLYEGLPKTVPSGPSDPWLPRPVEAKPERIVVPSGTVGSISITPADAEAIRKAIEDRSEAAPPSIPGPQAASMFDAAGTTNKRALDPREGRKNLIGLPDTMGPRRNRIA